MKIDSWMQRANRWLPDGRGVGKLGETGAEDGEIQTSSYIISHGDIIQSMKNMVNNIEVNFLWGQMVTRHCGNHFLMHANVKSLVHLKLV